MFVDQAKIYVKAGDGGDGCLAFRREKFVPRGGPSGGNGGNGGCVYLKSSEHRNTLLSFRFQQHFKAERGGHGSGNRRQGKSGEDLIVEVPVGTLAFDADSGELLCDLDRPGQMKRVAMGGRGGRGNAVFATSRNQAPRRCEPGFPGEERRLRLELKILADAGLIGLPNAGKSTLISVLSAARPKIADYPFTTLTPHLGVVTYHEFQSFVLADIPGLIEGAHAGGGLGDQFLRHIERCRLLLHLVDVSSSGPEDPAVAVEVISKELAHYGKGLLNKPQWIVATKMDAVDPARRDRLKTYCHGKGIEYLEVSSATRLGVEALVERVASQLQKGAA